MVRAFPLACLAAILLQVPAFAEQVRLRVDFIEWDRTDFQAASKASSCLDVPRHAKPAVSLTVTARIGEPSETKVRIGDESFTVIARISKITDGFVDAHFDVRDIKIDREHGIQVGSQFFPGGQSALAWGRWKLRWDKRLVLSGNGSEITDETGQLWQRNRAIAVTAIRRKETSRSKPKSPQSKGQ